MGKFDIKELVGFDIMGEQIHKGGLYHGTGGMLGMSSFSVRSISMSGTKERILMANLIPF